MPRALGIVIRKYKFVSAVPKRSQYTERLYVYTVNLKKREYSIVLSLLVRSDDKDIIALTGTRFLPREGPWSSP